MKVTRRHLSAYPEAKIMLTASCISRIFCSFSCPSIDLPFGLSVVLSILLSVCRSVFLSVFSSVCVFTAVLDSFHCHSSCDKFWRPVSVSWWLSVLIFYRVCVLNTHKNASSLRRKRKVQPSANNTFFRITTSSTFPITASSFRRNAPSISSE